MSGTDEVADKITGALTDEEIKHALTALGFNANINIVDSECRNVTRALEYAYGTWNYTLFTDRISGIVKATFQGEEDIFGYLDLRKEKVLSGTFYNQNSESVPETTENRAEISVEQAEAALKNVLGSEFAEYTFAMEDEDIIRYIRMDLNWQIEVKRRTGQAQVLNYRGVIMQEFQIE